MCQEKTNAFITPPVEPVPLIINGVLKERKGKDLTTDLTDLALDSERDLAGQRLLHYRRIALLRRQSLPQTNGMLLNQAWARFFREYQFLVAISLDGPEHVHDRYRRMPGGQGSWSKVSDNAKMLLDAGVSVNALTVVNVYSFRFLKEIYASHKGLGLLHMQFIPCVETDPDHPDRASLFSASAREYGIFYAGCSIGKLSLDIFAGQQICYREDVPEYQLRKAAISCKS